MADEQSTEELLKQLKLVKEEVAQIKKKLSLIGKEKETLFTQKRQVSDQIRNKISAVVGTKGERNTFTQEARTAKAERDKLNKHISERIDEIKKLKAEYNKMADKLGVKGNPAALKMQIDKLETTLETEPMSFEKEQKLMKTIKDIKKQYDQFKGVNEEWEKINAKSKEIDTLKRQANAYHKVVQDAAKSSQTQHEVIIEDSKGIDDLKVKEDELYKQFHEKKEAFKNISNELKDKLKELQTIKEQLEEKNVALAEEVKEKEQKSLKEKAREVQEKIRDKKKLTTEDLLIMQRSQK